MQMDPPQGTAPRFDPRPAEVDGAAFQAVPFQSWLPLGPNVMQLVALAQEMTLAQKQVWNSWQSTPRFGETSFHDLVVAFHVPASAMVPIWTSLEALPEAMQNARAQEMTFMA